jgi:hypothetical protein
MNKAIDESELQYWAHRGPKTAAFLLVIPGTAILGVGLGLLFQQLLPWSVMGVGGGLLLWGLIVALTKP